MNMQKRPLKKVVYIIAIGVFLLTGKAQAATLGNPPTIPSPDLQSFPYVMSGQTYVVYFDGTAITPQTGTYCEIHDTAHCTFITIAANLNKIGTAVDNTNPNVSYAYVNDGATFSPASPYKGQELYSGCDSINNCSNGPSAVPGADFIDTNNTLGGNNFYSNLVTVPNDLSTRILQPYTPENGNLSTSTTVVFSFEYFFNDSTSFGLFDTVAIEITDLTSGNATPTTIGNKTINSSGITTYTTNAILNAGHLYLWRPTIFSSTGASTQLYGDYSSLDIVFRSASSTPYTSATIGTSTLPNATNFLSFLNVPNLLVTKIPFAYFFQIADGIRQGISTTTNTQIPSGTITISGLRGASTTVDMFSTTTIGYYLTPTMVSLWRAFLLVILYIEFGYALYLRASHKGLI